MKSKINKTEINGLFVIDCFVVNDNRGNLIKDFNFNWFKKEFNINFSMDETFYTNSKKGVIRANHFQFKEPQIKIIRVIKGRIFDVVVDLRKGSPTYKKWLYFILDSKDTNPKMLFIPKGVSHGYLVLEDSIVSYKCEGEFFPEYDDGFIWNDEEININWPIDLIGEIIISDKDKNLKSFKEFEIYNTFKYEK